jgi:hypothetical protein
VTSDKIILPRWGAQNNIAFALGVRRTAASGAAAAGDGDFSGKPRHSSFSFPHSAR